MEQLCKALHNCSIAPQPPSTPKASEEQAAVNQPYVTIGNNQSQAYGLVQ